MTQPPYTEPPSDGPTAPLPGQWGQQPPPVPPPPPPPPPQQPGQWGPPGQWGQQPPQQPAPQSYPQPGYPPQGYPAQGPSQGPPQGYPQPGYPPQGPPQGYPAQGPPQQPWEAAPQAPQQWGQQPGYQQPGYQQPSIVFPTSRPRGRGKLIGATAAVIVLAGGGVATYVAFSDSNGKGGAGSPKQAVQTFVDDVNHSDFLGLLDDLAPGEKRALAGPVSDEIDQLKRLKVLSPDADPNNVSAVSVSASHLTFSNSTITVNDHVQIVQLTGGTLSVSADAAKIPLTKQFLDAAFPGGALPTGSTGKQTIDLADAVHEDGGKPIQIATEKVGGKWYPSLFYTIADYAALSANAGMPRPSDRIPDNGAGSADDAVRDLITALVQKDFKRAIELASPDELGVLHDYGPLLLQAVGTSGGGSSSFTLKDIEFNHKSISGGERLTLKSLDAQAGSQQVKVSVDGKGCFTVSIGGAARKLCGADLIDAAPAIAGGSDDLQLTSAQKTAFAHLLSGLSDVGIDVSQSGGAWYIDAVHSYFDVVGSVLSGLQPGDLYQLIAFFRSLN